MEYKKVGSSFLIRLEMGEEVIGKLEEFCGKEGIRSGHFSGIGGLETLELAYYDIRDRKYHPRKFGRPPYELLSLKGNVSTFEGRIKVHAHVVVGDKDFKTFGGHLNEGVVLPTCEIIFHPFEGEIRRKYSKETGLGLLETG